MMVYLKRREGFCRCHSIHQTIANRPGKGINLNTCHNNLGVSYLISQVSGDGNSRHNGKGSNHLGRNGPNNSNQGCIHRRNISNHHSTSDHP